MISFELPKTKLPSNFKRIHETLKSQNILGDYFPRFNFPDEPQFYQYMCERKTKLRHVKEGHGYGSSWNKKEAIIAAIAEAIEHYCLLYEQDKLLTKNSYKNLGKKAVNPKLFQAFTPKQLATREFKKFRFDENTQFNWIKGYSLPEKEEVLIPAQLVYANYSYTQRHESVIQVPISTGAACGPNYYFALYRGICEIIERDNYMITYLNKIKANTVYLKSNPHLAAFQKRIERYDLELSCIETTLDFPFTAIVAVICDKTGMGPAVSVGLGGSLDPRKAITSASLEAIRRHIASRDRFFRSKPPASPPKNSLDWLNEEKMRLWSAPHMTNVIGPFTSGPQKPFAQLANYSKTTNKENAEFLISKLKQKGYHVFVVDITIPEVEAVGLKVVKVLIPEMLPLFHDERYPYKDNQRLYNIPQELGLKRLTEDQINTSHPF